MDDAGIRRAPRLLRARLARLVPFLVTDDIAEAPVGFSRRDRSERRIWPTDAIRLLLPEGRPALVDLVRTTEDPRTLAGAIAAMGDLRQGADPEFLAAVADGWDADPDRVAAACRFLPRGSHAPLVGVALALALSGRASELPRLRDLLETDTLGSFGNELRVRLVMRGDGDLTIGDFVGRLEDDAVSADDQAEAARRALDAGLPWLARLLARRALFLSGAHDAARATLVAADEAIGLKATARVDGGLPPADGVADDPEAAEIDASLRAGRLSQRLLHRIEAGTDEAAGLAPVAIGDGFLVVGSTQGMVNLIAADTGRVLSSERTGVGRLPRGLAVSDGVVAAVTARGQVFYWRVGPQGLRRDRDERSGGESQAVSGLEPSRGFTVTAFAALEGGALLVAGSGVVLRFDPATETTTTLFEGDAESVRAAPWGRGAVVAHDATWDLLSETGERTGGGRLAEGTRITGVAGDAATGTVYVATAESLTALAAKDGAVRWVESIEGSANPVLGRGLVAVSAGLGTAEGGDLRRDRTISVLRAGIDRHDPFATEARLKAVEAAVAAAAAGRPAVARAILDPVAAWLTTPERWAADQALREEESRRREGRGDVKPEDVKPEDDKPGDDEPANDK
ncbi:MAG TPA: hypothetical protein VND21_00385 [Planctomycetota bacterium]|nr:hypothetical protein [Planctomycetota bacterium]